MYEDVTENTGLELTTTPPARIDPPVYAGYLQQTIEDLNAQIKTLMDVNMKSAREVMSDELASVEAECKRATMNFDAALARSIYLAKRTGKLGIVPRLKDWVIGKGL